MFKERKSIFLQWPKLTRSLETRLQSNDISKTYFSMFKRLRKHIITQAQFGDGLMGVYAHGIDAIYHPHTTQQVLPANT